MPAEDAAGTADAEARAGKVRERTTLWFKVCSREHCRAIPVEPAALRDKVVRDLAVDSVDNKVRARAAVAIK
jgi:hypothetical protein